MVSRLVLVGMVAALGVSIPSRVECESWFDSAREWASARLADWDTWRPSAADSCRVANAPVPALLPLSLRATTPRVPSESTSTLVVRPAAVERSVGLPSHREPVEGRTARIDRSPGRGPVAFEPIPVDDEPCRGIALELNRMAEGLELETPTTVDGELQTDLEPAVSMGSVEGKLALELYRLAAAWGAEGPGATPATSWRRQMEKPDPLADLFEENPDGYEPSAEGLASSVQTASLTGGVPPRFDPIDPPADLAGGIAEELNRFAEGIEFRPEDPATPMRRTPRFEPIDVAGDFEWGIADELNRAAEGLDIVAAQSSPPGDGARPPQAGAERAVQVLGALSGPVAQAGPEPGSTRDLRSTGPVEVQPSAADPGLEQALRLTREAACAWMQVLTGPALVQMTSR